MTTRVIAKRVSLDGVLDFDAECYAYVKPATVQDKRDFRTALDELKANTEAAPNYQQNVVDSHFVSGKVKALTEEGVKLVDMTQEDASIAEVSDYLYTHIMGFDIDPKDIAREAAQPKPPANDETLTETPSSTGSQTSPTTSPKS